MEKSVLLSGAGLLLSLVTGRIIKKKFSCVFPFLYHYWLVSSITVNIKFKTINRMHSP